VPARQPQCSAVSGVTFEPPLVVAAYGTPQPTGHYLTSNGTVSVHDFLAGGGARSIRAEQMR